MFQRSVIFGLALVLAVGAHAEERGHSRRRQRRPKTAPRKTQTGTSSKTTTTTTKKPSKPRDPWNPSIASPLRWKLAGARLPTAPVGHGHPLDIAGGMASISSSSSKDKAVRNNSNVDRNFYFGLNGDFQFGKYFGAGLDTYFSTGTAAAYPWRTPSAAASITAPENCLRRARLSTFKAAIRWITGAVFGTGARASVTGCSRSTRPILPFLRAPRNLS